MSPIPIVRARNHARSLGRVQPPSGSVELSSATAGDHLAVHGFLRHVFQGPSSQEFQTQQDEPTYEPRDRLLVKHGNQIVSHLRLIRREMRFGTSQFPITFLADLATAPEFCSRGYASALLATATRRMHEEGSVLGLLRTRQIRFFQRRGWIVCGRHSYSTAVPHAILSQLNKRQSAGLRRVPKHNAHDEPLPIRYWRRVEQEALTRLYGDDFDHAYGAFLRTEAGWHWLISRQAYDQIYVALGGSPRTESRGSATRIVGYAVVRGGRIAELLASAARPDAAKQLLTRICSDAVESDVRELRLDGPPGHPLHHIMLASGGVHHGCMVENGYAFMVRAVDLPRLVSLLHPEFLARGAAGGRDSPQDIGLSVDGALRVLQITRTHSRLAAGRPMRGCLQCSSQQLLRMLLGQIDVAATVGQGSMAASTQRVVEQASVLLPRLPLWYPAFDDLPA